MMHKNFCLIPIVSQLTQSTELILCVNAFMLFFVLDSNRSTHVFHLSQTLNSNYEPAVCSPDVMSYAIRTWFSPEGRQIPK